ncbi:MAG: AMIN domain-containing protein [Proteobacteria bacterium]|nr:AMIN domain-containing protein [Pseudomonadota bacterium]MBU1640911.1 AMIN domain-containing protein [Pseudomonadota bacterium]
MTPNIKIIKVFYLAFTHLLTLLFLVQIVSANVSGYQVADVSWAANGGEFSVRISGTSDPTYTMYELFAPQRIVFDIVDGDIAPSLAFPLKVSQGPVGMINGKMIEGQNPPVARIEIILDEEFAYSVVKDGSDLLVLFSANNEESELLVPMVNNQVTITDIQIDAVNPERATVLIYGSGPIGKFEAAEEAKDETHSARLLIDLPDVQMDDRVIPIALDSPVALVQVKQGSKGGKIILDSADNNLFTYDIKVNGNYMELSLVAKDVGNADDAQMVALLTGSGAEGSGGIAADAAFMALSEVQGDFADMAFPGASDDNNATDGNANINFSGYDEQKISVDFYKIDLHNVFRLIGEISNKNIIVDEAVSGSLTLSMKDVPWDFLLDVVLNLKDLEKEERFNTIVISPKSAGFSWPQTATTQLEVSVEPITVTKRLQTSKEKVEAKKLVHEASAEEAKGKDVEALALYEKAFQMWPENGDLAKRIAIMAMVKLGQNAKAAHYAKIAVQKNPQDYKSALIAAMNLANMEKVQEAKEYFDLAVSGNKPDKHALASYAAFSEQNGSYDAALVMLDQYVALYGSSLETMVSRARIYDLKGDVLRSDEEYKAILLSGFKLPEDLKAYITNRVQ